MEEISFRQLGYGTGINNWNEEELEQESRKLFTLHRTGTVLKGRLGKTTGDGYSIVKRFYAQKKIGDGGTSRGLWNLCLVQLGKIFVQGQRNTNSKEGERKGSGINCERGEQEYRFRWKVTMVKDK